MVGLADGRRVGRTDRRTVGQSGGRTVRWSDSRSVSRRRVGRSELLEGLDFGLSVTCLLLICLSVAYLSVMTSLFVRDLFAVFVVVVCSLFNCWNQKCMSQ